jgi:plastocyanin
MSRIGNAALPVLLVSATALGAGCGDSSTTPPGPSTPNPPPSVTVSVSLVISIVSSSGSQAFSPNPVGMPAGQTVVFRNESGRSHRIVADNGDWDTGTLVNGSSSTAISIASTSAVSYHCSIHSGMVGTIN